MSETSELVNETPTTVNDPFPGATADVAAGPVTLEPGPPEAPPVPVRRSEAPTPLNVHTGVAAPQWPPRVLGDLMTRKLIALGEDELLGNLEASMKHFRFRHLPVVGEGGKLVGLITRTDFLHAALGTAPDGKPTTEKIDENTSARTIMRRSVVTGRADTSIKDACEVMLREKLACLPIITEDKTLIGIVTETDFVKLTLELIERSKPA